MTLFLLNLRRVRPVISGDVEIPKIPELVWTERILIRKPTVHGNDRGEMTTRCKNQLWPFWLVQLDKVMSMQPEFCGDCWPGRRCVVCGLPSGGSAECERHLIASIDTDKQIERTAA